MTNVHLWTGNGLAGVKGHQRGPIRANPDAHVMLSCPMMATHRPGISLHLDQHDKLFRMHESKSRGQVHQSVKEGGGRRQNGGIEKGKGGDVKLMAFRQQ